MRWGRELVGHCPNQCYERVRIVTSPNLSPIGVFKKSDRESLNTKKTDYQMWNRKRSKFREVWSPKRLFLTKNGPIRVIFYERYRDVMSEETRREPSNFARWEEKRLFVRKFRTPHEIFHQTFRTQVSTKFRIWLNLLYLDSREVMIIYVPSLQMGPEPAPERRRSEGEQCSRAWDHCKLGTYTIL